MRWPHHLAVSPPLAIPLRFEQRRHVPGEQRFEFATLQAIEASTDAPAITYNEVTTPLQSGRSNTNGAFEPDGLYGMPMPDLLNMAGDYTFHVIATYGTGCMATRELQWSVHVEPGLDATKSSVTTTVTGSSGSTSNGTLVLTPRDHFGNNLRPGRGPTLTITGTLGTTVTGGIIDNGDGTYRIPVSWPSSSGGPTVSVSQPNHPPVVLGTAATAGATPCRWCKRLFWLPVFLLLLLLILWWLL